MKRVLIRELREAAVKRGWVPQVNIFRSPVHDVIWAVSVIDWQADVSRAHLVTARADSRQGALRMALAALKAK